MPRIFSVVLLALAVSRTGIAQSSTPATLQAVVSSGDVAGHSSDRTDSETVTLPDFAVRDTRTGAYGAKEATATTRISIPIQEVAQTVSVVTRELMDDTQGLRMLDTAKFVTPILENTSTAGDSYSIRGFRTLQRFIDGVNVAPLANSMWSDTTNIERLEITKGPNAILVPGGGFGGMLNQITKSPKYESFTNLALHARTYLGSEASLDANRVFHGGKSAARAVATVWNSDGYFNGQYRRGWLVAPSFAHRFANGVDLLMKMESLENKESGGMGVEIDPAIGTSTGGYARRHPLLPRDNMWGPTSEHRYRRETRLSSELRFTVFGNTAAHLWLMADHVFFSTPGIGGGASAAGLQGNRHPLTGEWVPFKSFTYSAATGTLTTTNLTPSTNTRFNRTNRQLFELRGDELHFKNDYATEYRLGPSATGTTVVGLSANWQAGIETQNWRTSRPVLDFATGRAVGADEPLTMVLIRDKKVDQRDAQVFAYQRFKLWDDRFIASAGIAGFHGVLKRLDDSGLPPTLQPKTSNTVTDANLGAIYKPAPQVSIFAGYNRVGGALPVSTTAGEFTTGSFRVGVGTQLELGVKTSWLKDRISTSAAWFSIDQGNVSVTNPAFQANPATEPPFLYFDLASRGWEIEFNALVTPELEVVGNATHMRMRDSYGIRQSMVPDDAAALFAQYTFHAGRWKGIGLSVGLEHIGKVAGDQATFLTAAGVPNQPSFYLEPRTLLQAGVSYRRGHWSLRVVVNNLANEDYFQSSANRTVLLPAEPRNTSVSFQSRF